MLYDFNIHEGNLLNFYTKKRCIHWDICVSEILDLHIFRSPNAVFAQNSCINAHKSTGDWCKIGVNQGSEIGLGVKNVR